MKNIFCFIILGFLISTTAQATLTNNYVPRVKSATATCPNGPGTCPSVQNSALFDNGTTVTSSEPIVMNGASTGSIFSGYGIQMDPNNSTGTSLNPALTMLTNGDICLGLTNTTCTTPFSLLGNVYFATLPGNLATFNMNGTNFGAMYNTSGDSTLYFGPTTVLGTVPASSYFSIDFDTGVTSITTPYFPGNSVANGYVWTSTGTNGAGHWAAGGGGSQTPWSSNINGAGYALTNAGLNWQNLQNLNSTKGINWNGNIFQNVSGINWDTIKNIATGSVNWGGLTITNLGINWAGVKDLGTQTANWYDITQIVSSVQAVGASSLPNVQMFDSSGVNWIGLLAPSIINANVNWMLPSTDGTTGQVWGTNGKGAFSWKSIEQTISYQPGLLTAVNANIGVYGKFVQASTVDNLIGSATTFSCVGNPTITMYECGTSTTCTSSPVTIGTVTITSNATAFVGTVSNPIITAGDYVGFATTSGTCASSDLTATAQVHLT